MFPVYFVNYDRLAHEGVNLLNYTKKPYSPLILSFSLREKGLAFYYIKSPQLFLKINFEIGSKKYIREMKI